MQIRQIKDFALRLWRSAWLKRAEGTEIIEFAASLPLLIVLVVGIYDFGTAFTLKHKLTNTVREGARMASSQHFPLESNTACGAPASVCLIRDLVSSTLSASNVDDCGLASAHGLPAGSFAWTFTGTCAEAQLKIERNVLNTNKGHLVDPFETADYRVENTTITLVYPYEWKFNGVFKVLDKNANYLTSTITVTATMQNLE